MMATLQIFLQQNEVKGGRTMKLISWERVIIMLSIESNRVTQFEGLPSYYMCLEVTNENNDDFVPDCSISSALAMEIPQSCT